MRLESLLAIDWDLPNSWTGVLGASERFVRVSFLSYDSAETFISPFNVVWTNSRRLLPSEYTCAGYELLSVAFD